MLKSFVRSLLLAVVLAPGIAYSAGNEGPDLELICPCTYTNASASSVIAAVGVVNRGNSNSGELILRAYAHDNEDYFQSADPEFLGDLTLTTGLDGDSQINIQNYQARINQPVSGSYYVTFLLLQNNFIQDYTRMSEQVTFGTVPARTFSGLYFATDPTFSINGSTLTLNIPAIGNSGSSDETVQVTMAASEAQEFFGVPIQPMYEDDSSFTVPAGGQSAARTVTVNNFSEPSIGDFYHVSVGDGNATLLLHTLQAPGVNFSQQDYALDSLDFLTDSDGDGVADDNEAIAGTNPASSSSTPGLSYVDLYVVHAADVTTFYDGDPSTRIEHLVEVSNQAMIDSNVDMRLRVVGIDELAMDTTQNISQWLTAAENGSGVFSDLQASRENLGADLITMFRLYDGGNVCGLATLGGFATQGIVGRTEHISASFIEFDECGDITMIHEIGHNIGLGHSFRQNETGTFIWSRGHGLDDRFATLMAYASEFNLFREISYFSNPAVNECDNTACGVSANAANGADAASSINAVRFQVANFTASKSADADADGVADAEDAFPDDATETVDSDNDGLGNNADYDDDNDGMPDIYELAVGHDPIVADGDADDDADGTSNLDEYLAVPRATQYLQTSANGANVTRLHLINTSDQTQSFSASLYESSGQRLGPANQSLGGAVEPNGRLVLDSSDLESLFGISAWAGPAMLEVDGANSFSLMAKLSSPSGLISNTNCVRENRVLNIEGFDSSNLTFVRIINTGDNALGEITGTLYDVNGDIIGDGNFTLASSLAPKQQIFVNRNSFATLAGSEWQGEAMLEVEEANGLKLLNLNFVNQETFFNFSCFEDATSGRIYLQTTSNSNNVSSTHVVNTSGNSQQFRGTLYNGAGEQLGLADQLLHSGSVAPRGRVILSSSAIEDAVGSAPWSGPAVLEITGSGTFEVMTKLESTSGLVSNTNCVREGEVHNIEGFDSSDLTFVRFINTSDTAITNITGSLYDSSGDVLGSENQVILESLAAKQQVFVNRNDLSEVFDTTWNGEAMLRVNQTGDLKLLNLNRINSETFFNFSCYEES